MCGAPVAAHLLDIQFYFPARPLRLVFDTYVFTVGSTGDSPVPSGDPPDGTEHGIEGNDAVFSHSGYTTTPPGESPGGVVV